MPFERGKELGTIWRSKECLREDLKDTRAMESLPLFHLTPLRGECLLWSPGSKSPFCTKSK